MESAVDDKAFKKRIQEITKEPGISRRRFLEMMGKVGIALPFVGTGLLSSDANKQPEVELGESIYTQDFFIKKRSEGLIGTHRMSQVVEGNTIFYVKHEPKAFEQFTMAENGDIFLRLDHSNPKKPYTFSNGLFLPANMRVGQTVRVRDNDIQWYDENKQPVAENSGKWPYDISLLEHNPAFNIGGDLGVQDVIILRYNYFSDYEHFLYSKEWGWIGWEWYDKNNQLKNRAIFNYITKENHGPQKNSLTAQN